MVNNANANKIVSFLKSFAQQAMCTKEEGYRCFRGEFRKDRLIAIKVQNLLLFQVRENYQSSRTMPLTGVLYFLFGSDVFAFFPSFSVEFSCADSRDYFLRVFHNFQSGVSKGKEN